MTGAAAIVTAAFLEPPRAGKSVKDLAEGGGGSFGLAPPERQEEARGGIPEDSNAEEEEEEDRLEANAAEKLILTNNPSFELFAALGKK
jgi:hypothetical protein